MPVSKKELIICVNLAANPAPQVIVGLVVSGVLFLLSFYLIGQPFFSRGLVHAHTVLEDAGMLQLTWLLGNEHHLSKVENPDTQTLRAAGMFDVQMNERAEEKVLQALQSSDLEDIGVLLRGTRDEPEYSRLLA